MFIQRNYRTKRYIYIGVSVLLGIFCFAIIEMSVAKYQRNTAAINIMEQLDIDEFSLAVGPAIQEADLTEVPYIEWWFDEVTEKYYLFLPDFFENNGRIVWSIKNAECIWINEKEISSGDRFELEEGEYCIEANGTYALEVMFSSNIASMFINTESGSLEYIHESKENEEFAQYVLFDKLGKLNNYGYIDSFRCRGNASFANSDKKSYRIKLNDNSYFLELGEDRDWLLLANDVDRTLSKNMIVNAIADGVGMAYVPDMSYVDLYVNGEYIGNYVLSESIEIDDDRVNIRDLEKETETMNLAVDLSQTEMVVEDPDKLFSRKWHKIENEPDNCIGGYLLEIELLDRYGLEASGFITSRMQGVVLHSPKYASLNQIGYIADLYQDFEDAVFDEDGLNRNTGKYFYEYIDMESFAQKYMIEELVKNLDASYTSFFMYSPERENKLYAGPVWDYDKALGYNTITNEGIDLDDSQGIYAAYKKKDSDILAALYLQPYFRKYICGTPMEELSDVVKNMIEVYIDTNVEAIIDSAMMNDVRWNKFGEGNTREEKKNLFIEKNNDIKVFLKERMEYLTKEWEYTEY